MAEVLKHHGPAPNLPDWVGDAAPKNIWRAAMHRLGL
jgi:hypothetical protein